MNDSHSDDDRSALAKSLGRASEASAVVFTIGLCFLGGYGLDRVFNTSPVLALIGLGLGLTTAFWQLLQMARRMTNSGDSDKRDSSGKQPDKKP